MTQLEINDNLSLYYENWEKKEQILTVFVTTHKRPNYLRLALNAIINQTYNNFYIIVLDNNSRDETKDVVAGIKDERIIYVEHEASKEYSNIQYAFQLYRTKYILVLHDDDVILPNLVEEELLFLEKNEGFVSVSVCANIIDSEGNLIKKADNNETIRVYQGREYIDSYLQKSKDYKSIVYPSAMYRGSFYKDRSAFVNSLVGPSIDQYVWFQTERFGGKIAVIQKGLINYRIHQNQDSILRGSDMSIRLLNYLMTDEYYKKIILDNVGNLSRLFKTYLQTGIEGFEKGFLSKKELKRLYGLIDYRYISKGSRKYVLLYKVFTLFPKITVFIYLLQRKIKK